MVQNFVDTYPRFALTYRLSQAPHSISYQEDTFMKFRLPIFSRREFIKTTTSAGTVASLGGALFAPSMVQTSKTPVGKKGQSYPDERRKYTDSKSGKTVWQLTNNRRDERRRIRITTSQKSRPTSAGRFTLPTGTARRRDNTICSKWTSARARAFSLPSRVTSRRPITSC
ncbi:MAG: hypothetical protein DMG13_29605 [Acidobacteria bacterium]|nr:MAG: hypothetical protein DMG13_29605 [Acidobacteriota bacterium]